MRPLRVFIGADPRQPVAYTVCSSSVLRHAKRRVHVEPIGLHQWGEPPIKRGLTTFSVARYLVPYLCNFEGTAVFIDADIIVRGDINELAEYAYQQPKAFLCVAKHVKRFEWPSVMVFNNWHCKVLTPDYINATQPALLEWASEIGDLPKQWNHCIGYEEHNEEAKLLHFTAGIPCWPETKDSPHAEKWREELDYALGSVSYKELMGNSIHDPIVRNKQLKRFAEKTA